MTAIRCLLIANRGEIACRIAATARRQGIRTVAVYSDADADAMHVAACDTAVRLGAAPAGDSYLAIDKVIATARTAGADAVHPGYGFLAESARFAAACAAAGLVFVGPPAAVIEGLGLKGAAKDVAIKAGVPVLPGYNGARQDDATLAREAGRIGFPLAVKAAAGGGGRGLRVVRAAGELAGALESARREAKGAFDDDRMILERWLDAPRHVEVQVVADDHGHVVHLGARDCSVQRRHQKVVEEAPAPLLGADLARRMGDAAVTLARAAGYRNAGTIEFLVEGEAFYFLEANTRLQVEHPVTEMVHGVDLVAWQLAVAAGDPLPLAQDAVRARGHAIEVRLCAEDPARGFLPQGGVVEHLVWPAGEGLRIDTGIREGSRVGLDYDSLLAKLIVWGEDRDTARRRLVAALDALQVAGVATNARFLRAVLADADFAAGGVATPFLARKGDALIPQPAPAPPAIVAAAAVAWVQGRGHDGLSPWTMGRPWRLNAPASETLDFRDGETERTIVLTHEPVGYTVAIDGHVVRAHGALRGAGHNALVLDHTSVVFGVHRTAGGVTLFAGGEAHHLVFVDPLTAGEQAEIAGGHLRAPMPGRVIKLHVAEGDAVVFGQPLVVLEAMKMEHTIQAPDSGRVLRLPFAVGDLVEEGVELVVLASKDT